MNKMVIFSLLLSIIVVAIDALSVMSLKRKVQQRKLQNASPEFEGNR